MELLSASKAFGGSQRVYRHDSAACACPMTFAIYLPHQIEDGPVPLLWYLSGLTCTHQNVMDKGEYRAAAAANGIAIICPDTSPRGEGVPDEPENWQFGSGAGFYVDATQAPYAANYRMASYVLDELPRLVAEAFPADMSRQGIFGHSMGGHGALTIAMSFPGRFASVSAFAPICEPTRSDWGRKQFSAYLGSDETLWAGHDSSHLMRRFGFDGPMLIDQGTSDQFLDLLRPEALATAMTERRQGGTFRMQKGYDHSYFFVSTFMEDHVDFHAQALRG